jgi:hypothetical protein
VSFMPTDPDAPSDYGTGLSLEVEALKAELATAGHMLTEITGVCRDVSARLTVLAAVLGSYTDEVKP